MVLAASKIMYRILSGFLRLGVVAAALSVTACQTTDGGTALGRARDLDGKLLGWQNWRPVSEEEAKLQLAGDVRLVRVREAVTLASRYQERWTLVGGHLFYEALTRGGFPATDAEPDFLARLYGDDTALSDRGVRVEAEQVQWNGRMLLATPASPSHTCVIFALFLGESRFEGSPGNRLLRGGLCADQALATVEDVQAQLRDLLGRLSIGGVPVLEAGGERAQGFLEPDRPPAGLPQELAVAHDGAASDYRRHGPSGDPHSVIGRPAALAQH